MKEKLLDIDLFAGFLVIAWAVASLWIDELNQLADHKVAFAFGVAALGRWFAKHAKQAKLAEGKEDDDAGKSDTGQA